MEEWIGSLAIPYRWQLNGIVHSERNHIADTIFLYIHSTTYLPLLSWMAFMKDELHAIKFWYAHSNAL